ncbi:hypothetical protein ACEUZ9_002786 [Paracoccus litorisediminis]|uniref:hypothetical protein n=1 Tax=Paracoccus litorisediminis TaxID=2006130 RepID=UPI00373154BB
MDRLISTFSSYGMTKVVIRCDGPGWMSYFYDSYSEDGGFACGFASAQDVQDAAFDELPPTNTVVWKGFRGR